jgi:hypothetical protein
VVVVVVVGMLVVQEVLIAVAALRSMLEERESPDESLLDVPVVVAVVALRSVRGSGTVGSILGPSLET